MFETIAHVLAKIRKRVIFKYRVGDGRTEGGTEESIVVVRRDGELQFSDSRTIERQIVQFDDRERCIELRTIQVETCKKCSKIRPDAGYVSTRESHYARDDIRIESS